MNCPLVIDFSDNESAIMTSDKFNLFPYIAQNMDLIKPEICKLSTKEISLKLIKLPFTSTAYNELYLAVVAHISPKHISKDLYLLAEYLHVDCSAYINSDSRFSQELSEYLYEQKSQNKDFNLYFNSLCINIQKKYLLEVRNIIAPLHNDFFVMLSDEDNDGNNDPYYCSGFVTLKSILDMNDYNTIFAENNDILDLISQNKTRPPKKKRIDDDDKEFPVFGMSSSHMSNKYVLISFSEDDSVVFTLEDLQNIEDSCSNLIVIGKSSRFYCKKNITTSNLRYDRSFIIKRIGSTFIMLIRHHAEIAFSDDTLAIAVFSLNDLQRDQIAVKLISNVQLIWQRGSSINSINYYNGTTENKDFNNIMLYAIKKN